MENNATTTPGYNVDAVREIEAFADSIDWEDAAKPRSIFVGKTANRTITEAMGRPTPRNLWQSLWFEGEACCLFSDSNLGKSILAVQIADEISRHEKVALFDFELSDKQFQLRYCDEEGGNPHVFSNKLTRYEIDPLGLPDGNFEDAVLRGIEDAINETDTKILIIDNLTYLCIAAEKSDAAGLLMMRLMALKRAYGLSILVLAHTPKRCLSAAITQNDLAGSKKLFNFFDSSFAIGKSSLDEDLRYVKQIKCRNGAFTYNSDNVIVYRLEKLNSNFLHFEFVEYSNERRHLKEQGDAEVDELNSEVIQLQSQGMSYRAIADAKSISLAKVQRILKNHNCIK